MVRATDVQRRSLPQTEPLLAFVLGCFITVALVPAFWQAFVVVGITTELGLVLGAITVLSGSVVVWSVGLARRRGIAQRLGRPRWRWLAPLCGASWFGIALFPTGTVHDMLPDSTVALVLLSGTVATPLGFVVAKMCHTRYANYRRERATAQRTFVAVQPPARNHRLSVRNFVVSQGWLLLAVIEYFELPVVLYLIPLATIVVYVLGDQPAGKRTLTITDDGLHVDGQFSNWWYDWSLIDGVEVTDDRLVIALDRPYRSTLHCDRDEIDAVDDLVRSFDTHTRTTCPHRG